MNDTMQQFAENNPLTNRRTTYWSEIDTDASFDLADVDGDRIIIYDDRTARDFFDFEDLYATLVEQIENEPVDAHTLVDVTFFTIRRLSYGIPASGVYLVAREAMSAGEPAHDQLPGYIQALSACLAGWLAEDLRYERIPVRDGPPESSALSYWVIGDHLAEAVETLSFAETDDGYSIQDEALETLPA